MKQRSQFHQQWGRYYTENMRKDLTADEIFSFQRAFYGGAVCTVCAICNTDKQNHRTLMTEIMRDYQGLCTDQQPWPAPRSVLAADWSKYSRTLRWFTPQAEKDALQHAFFTGAAGCIYVFDRLDNQNVEAELIMDELNTIQETRSCI